MSHLAGGVTKHVIQERNGKQIRAVYLEGGNTCADICLTTWRLVCESLDKELQLSPSPSRAIKRVEERNKLFSLPLTPTFQQVGGI